MATELTWASDVNKTVADQSTTAKSAAWEAWYLLASLVGNSNTPFSGNAGNWTLYASSDGSTAGIDTTDRLKITGSNTFDSAKFVIAAAGTAHSWCTLKSPADFCGTGGYIYFTLDMNNATPGTWSFAFSKTAPAAVTQSGTTTNGSATVTTPVTTNVVNLLVGMSVSGTGIPANEYVTAASTNGTTLTITTGTGVTAGTNNLTFSGGITSRYTATDEWSYAGILINNNSVAANHRVNIHLSTRGDWWFYESPDNNSLSPYSVTGCTILSNTHSADQYPVVTICIGSNKASSNDTGFGIGGAAVGQSICGIFNGIFKTRNYNGTAIPSWVTPFYCYYTNNNNGSFNSVITNTDLTVANVSDSTYNALPIVYLLSPATGQTEIKGRIMDALVVSGGLNNGTTTPSSTPYEYTKIGGLLLPWISSSSPTF